MTCKGWEQEAALRMRMNNLDPDVAGRPQDLVAYGAVDLPQGLTLAQGRYLLQRAKGIGMKLKLHAEERVSCGGTELAAELGAISADHLLAASSDGLQAVTRDDQDVL